MTNERSKRKNVSPFEWAAGEFLLGTELKMTEKFLLKLRAY